LIQAYLHEVKSDLYEESKHISLENLTRNMHIAKGSNEYLRPVNVGLLFFSREPEKFFDRTWIEVVLHKDDVGDNFTEHYFKGALHHQLRNALNFIKTNIIHEHVIKVPNQAEALRFYNYPYEAVEEALGNAVYHKAYDLRSPIEVQIFMDCITVLSYPGAVPPVGQQILKHEKIVARSYRNRRIGDFLKELDLTEGRGTGFPKMKKKMENNGSPQPIIETDEESNYFMVTLPINQEYVAYMGDQVSDQAGDQVNNFIFNSLDDLVVFSNQANDIVNDKAKIILKEQMHNIVEEILNATTNWIKTEELFSAVKLSKHPDNRKKYLGPLLKIGWVEMEFPDKKTSPNQRYRITESGKKLLQIINKKG
jgi:ATP-dependent DNA helicase RecG